MGRIFEGVAQGGLYRGALLPVLATDQPLAACLAHLSRLDPGILPSSSRKIAHSKVRVYLPTYLPTVVGGGRGGGAALCPMHA